MAEEQERSTVVEMLEKNPPNCPHCKKTMVKWETPPMAKWDSPYMWVCFNDECDYFVKGWDSMMERYNVTASYRYKFDAFTGEKGPLPVWSRDAMKSGIVGFDPKESK